VEYIDLQTWGYLSPGFLIPVAVANRFKMSVIFSPNRHHDGPGPVADPVQGAGSDAPGDLSCPLRP
jgi:hypothetical protein